MVRSLFAEAMRVTDLIRWTLSEPSCDERLGRDCWYGRRSEIDVCHFGTGTLNGDLSARVRTDGGRSIQWEVTTVKDLRGVNSGSRLTTSPSRWCLEKAAAIDRTPRAIDH